PRTGRSRRPTERPRGPGRRTRASRRPRRSGCRASRGSGARGRRRSTTRSLERDLGAVEVGVLLCEWKLGERLPVLGRISLRPLLLEGDCGGATLHLARVQQCGQRLGDIVEDSLARLVGALDLLPPLPNAPRGPGLNVTEDVGMAADELFVRAACDGLEILTA